MSNTHIDVTVKITPEGGAPIEKTVGMLHSSEHGPVDPYIIGLEAKTIAEGLLNIKTKERDGGRA